MHCGHVRKKRNIECKNGNGRSAHFLVLGDAQDKIYKMLSFAGYEDTQKFTGARDVADPWYTGNFDETYEDVVAGCKGFLYYLQQKGDISKEIEIPR